jgi:hypothetical protein
VCDVLNVTINNGGNVITRSRTYVVIAIEQHEQNADSGRKQEKTIFGKCVRLEKPSAIAHTNLIERLFIVAVQWCEIDV